MIDRQVHYTPRTIKKSNLLIEHCRKLTTLSYKFFDTVIYHIQNSPDKTVYSIKKAELQRLIGSDKNYQSHKKLKKIVDNLLTELVELIEPKINSFDTTCFLSSAKLNKKGILEVEVSNSLKSLINLDHKHDEKTKTINYGYTSIDLNKLNELRRKYSLILYEYFLMKLNYNNSYKKEKNYTEQFIDIDYLYKLLCNNKKSYKDIDLFKRKILKPAIDEINAITDLEISYEDIKCEFDNKTITGFKFMIKQHEKKPKTRVLEIIEAEEIEEIQETTFNQPIKTIYAKERKEEVQEKIKPTKKQPEIEYPSVVQEIINIGVKPASKVLAWYKQDDKRLIANWNEIISKYSQKSNIEKAKLLAYLWKIEANCLTTAEKEQQEKELAYNLMQKEKAEQQNRENILKEQENRQKVLKAFEETKEYYNALNDKDKIELLYKSVESFEAVGFNIRNKYIVNGKYKNYDDLNNSAKSMIMNKLGFNSIKESIIEPPRILSYQDNEKLEAEKSMRRLVNSPEIK